MAASLRTPGAYYVVSDEVGTSRVAVVSEDGALRATIEIDGMAARNAEALATGPCGGDDDRTCLYIGDTGNHVDHPDMFVYRVPEPDLASPPESADAEMLRYTYPGAPTDAEGLLVDAEARPLIISKPDRDDGTEEAGRTVLYRGPADGGELEYLTEITLPDPEDSVFAEFVGNVVTGASASDGAVLLRTYDEVLEFRTDDDSADLATFPDWPMRRVPSPDQLQSESITYRSDDCGYLTTAEVFGDIALVTCEDSDA
jgi:hypothetical protein